MEQRKWKELPLKVKLFFLQEQEKQGNKRNIKVFENNLYATESEGGFKWGRSSDGVVMLEVTRYLKRIQDGVSNDVLKLEDFRVTAQEVIDRYPILKKPIKDKIWKSKIDRKLFKNYEELTEVFTWNEVNLPDSYEFFLLCNTRDWKNANKMVKHWLGEGYLEAPRNNDSDFPKSINTGEDILIQILNKLDKMEELIKNQK